MKNNWNASSPTRITIPQLFTLTCLIYCIKALHVSDMYVSQNKSSATDTSVLCQNRGLVGGEEFNWCQPNNCSLLATRNIDGTIKEKLFWIHGYVVRLPLLKYEDCFNSSHPQSISGNVTSLTMFENNNVYKCSRYCVLEKKGNIGNYIYLTNTTCFCVSNQLHSSWVNSNMIQRTATDTCNVRCPGRDLDMCGRHVDIDQQHFAIYSVYMFAPDIITDAKEGKIAHSCPYLGEDKRVRYTDCHSKFQFNCQEYFASIEKKTRIHQKCSKESLSWYEAEQSCAANGRYIQTDSEPTNCSGINVPLWKGSFVPELIVWNSYPDMFKDMSIVLCLAVSAEQGDKYRLLSLNCTETHRAWCRKLENVEIREKSNVSQSDINRTTPIDTNVWYIISPLLFLVALAVVISLWHYRKVHRTNNTLHINVMGEEAPYDAIDYSNMDVISPVPEPPTVVNTYDKRIDDADAREETTYSISTDEGGYLNSYQPLKEDWQISSHVYESARKPTENRAPLFAESSNQYTHHEYESLNKAQPDDNIYEKI